MKILIISPFENDSTDRGVRNIYLYNQLKKKRHKVFFWTSNFDHASKKNIYNIKSQKNFIYNNIIGYTNNLSLRRIICHIQLAIKLFFYLKKNKFNLIFLSSIPPELLLVIRKKKFILDVRDIWPDAINNYSKKKILKFFFTKYCNLIYQYCLPKAAGFTIVAESYSEWLHRYSITSNKIEYFPLGFRTNSKKINKPYLYKFCYAGGLTPQFDLEEFSEILKDGKNLCIIGSGPLHSKYSTLYPKAIFVGQVARKVAISIMNRSEFLLFPSNKYAKLPNKIFDYIASENKIILGNDLSIDVKNLISQFKYKKYFNFSLIEVGKNKKFYSLKLENIISSMVKYLEKV